MIDVALRLGLKGGTDVERGLKAVGQEGKTSLREIREAARGLPPSMVAVSRSVAGVKDSIADLASRAPAGLGNVAGSFGIVGTAAAGAGVAVGAAVVAMMRMGVAAANVGDELGGAALRIGVGAEELQKLRFAAGEVDVQVGELDAGLQGLNRALGAFKTGVGDTRVKKAFEELGITRESLADVRDAADFLPILADRIAQVQGQAARVKLAAALGAEALLPVLEQGSEGLRRFGEAAEAAGMLLSDGLIKELGELHRRMEIADARLKVASTTLGAEFAPSVAKAKEELAGLFLKAAAAADSLQWVADGLDIAAKATDGATDKLIEYVRWLRFIPGIDVGARFLPDRGATADGKPLNPGFELSGDYSGNPRQAGTLQPGWQAEVDRLQAEAAKAAKAGKSSGRSTADAARRKAELAERQAKLLEEIKLQNQLEQAKARGAQHLIDLLEEQLAIRALANRYEQAGLDEVKARLEAEKEIAALRWLQSIRPIDTTTPEGFVSSEERMKALHAPFQLDWDALREDFRVSFKDGMRAALDADFGDFLASRVEEAFIRGLDDSLDEMADALFNLVRQAFESGSAGMGGGEGGGGWMSAAVGFVGSLFGLGGPAGRATGGPVYRGDTRTVGEQGRERLTFAADGYVHDAATTARQIADARPTAPASSDRGGGGDGAVTVNITTPPGLALRPQVTESRDQAGGRRLDIELFEMIDRRVDDRVTAFTRGGRDDQVLSREFGLRRNLRGG